MSFSSITFPSNRSDVYAREGMVATSQPLAAQAGLAVLQAGGNAVDAAIATAATLCVVEPCSTGLGGDAFALIHNELDGKLYGLNSSGPAPMELTREKIIDAGFPNEMPTTGALPITVPGALKGWEAALSRFGTMKLDKLLERPIRYAEEGFPVSPVIAASWAKSKEKFAEYPESRERWFPDGNAPRAGEIFKNIPFAKALRSICEGGTDVFYKGWIGQDIVDCVRKYGGVLNESDLANFEPEWVTPLSVNYQNGFTFHELPPNGQGLAALLALNIVNHFDLHEMSFDSSERIHLMIEAMKLGYADAHAYIADPKSVNVPVKELLSEDYTRKRMWEVRDGVAMIPKPGILPTASETVLLATADKWGNRVSWIQSLYMGFGSGLTAPLSGIQLQNRGANFSMDPEHPNVVAGGKRPYHTIIPMAISRDGEMYAVGGVMGGFMQPQGHLQVGVNLVDLEMSPQQALNAPRFNWLHGRHVALERSMPENIKLDLERWGHDLAHDEEVSRTHFGGGQLIACLPDGAMVGGTEMRNDGLVVGY